jgi:hypothetical protein
MQTALKSQETSLPVIHSLDAEAKKAFMRGEYAKQSRFQREFGADSVDLDCGPHAQSLQNELIRLLNAKGIAADKSNLTRLHESLPQEMKDYNYDDGVNKITTLLYDTDEAYLNVYHAFIRDCVQKHFPYPFYFQATTTIRVHCPGGKNANHYPRYHTDIGYGHPPQEINLWIPLTEPQGPQRHGFRRMDVSASRDTLEPFNYDFAPFIEKAVNDKPYNHALNARAPQVATSFGKMHAFDSRCIHTGEPLEEHTRISMDIRIIPVSDFNAMPYEYRGTGRRQMPYIPGKAYFPRSSDAF